MVLCATAVMGLTNSPILVLEFHHPSPSNRIAPKECTQATSSSSSQILTVTQHCPLPLKCSVKILKQVPHASREQAASKLGTPLLVKVTTPHGAASYSSARGILEGARMVKRCSLASIVNRKLREEADLPVSRRSSRSNRQSTKSSPRDPVAY